ncbi:TonB-dependent receptor plug [uncultured Paludibacter sp.]|uniref:TonB-dependent receptor plug n=1 Tax=uncultured Paludibacter sp. TaxID=497635 RepID=A0A653A9Y2_9BACT|nr:TonB-dependent receptor plug [uncultured Paludibacter sp.]
MKRLNLLLFTFLSIFSLSAQYSIQGNVKEKKTGNPMELATVRLITLKDSSLVSGTRTDTNGKFIMNNIKSGSYILSVSSIGYINNDRKISVQDKDMDLGTISVEEDVKTLNEVEVKGTMVQVIVKKDTLEYNAQAFKTDRNAVVEDLLKKMPGVQVATDGTITVNGQEVTKILVDGKKFFQGDVQMSTKNIPADLIDKVQVVDQKSEMAQLTGFEDNNTERVINLTIKKDRKQGVFGNIMAGAGADINKDFRYDSNGFLNIMNGDTRSTFTLGANNVNTMRSGRGRGGFGGSPSGITETQNFGYNLNSTVSKKMVLGGDATFNHSDNLQTSDSHRENYLQDLTYTTVSNNTSNRNNYQGNIRLEAEWHPDSINTLIIQPNIGFTRSFSNSKSGFLYKTQNDSTSWGNTDNSSESYGISGGLNLIYSHKFPKKGRTLTTNINSGISQSNTDGKNYNQKITQDSTSLVDQKVDEKSYKNNVGLRISYVEPLWKNKHFLETSISLNGVFSENDRKIYGNDGNDNYNVFNAAYSNNFNNKFFNEALELNYRYMEENYNLLLGFKTEPSQTFSSRIYGDNTETPIENKVINFAPTARFQYNFGRRRFIRMDYSGRTSQPSISQMQPVKNNADLMNETVGNPDLKPEFQHNLRFMFSTYSSKNFSSFNVGLMGRATKNDLENNSIYDTTGKRYIQTVNGEKIPYRVNLFTMYNLPFFKYFNFSNNASFGFNQQYGYTSKNVSNVDATNLIYGDLSSTQSLNASENISLGYTQDMMDFGIRGGLRYSNTKNNLTTNLAQTYDWNGGANVVFRPTKIVTFSSDLIYTTQRGYSNFNEDQWLWNASLDFSLFKNLGVLSFKAVDILQERQNVTQSVGDNYVQYSKTNALPSYYLMSFTYKINKFKGSKNSVNPAEEMGNPMERRWRRDGGGRPPSGNRGGGTPPPPPGGDM